jgi:FKBP-type peptidyl-prolyl cis-trans isomerase
LSEITANVSFIDYGNDDDDTDKFQISAMSKELKEIPPLAINCSLEPEIKSPEAFKKFEELVNDTVPFDVKLMSKLNDKMIVKLYICKNGIMISENSLLDGSVLLDKPQVAGRKKLGEKTKVIVSNNKTAFDIDLDCTEQKENSMLENSINQQNITLGVSDFDKSEWSAVRKYTLEGMIDESTWTVTNDDETREESINRVENSIDNSLWSQTKLFVIHTHTKSEKPQQVYKKENKNTKKQKLQTKNLNGVQIQDLRIGKGLVTQKGKYVYVYYQGKLKQNGKQFDACQSGKPFKFRLGSDEVIKGWNIGIAGMKVGSKRTLTIPSNLAYGNRKLMGIPPNSTLVFEVEVKAIS